LSDVLIISMTSSYLACGAPLLSRSFFSLIALLFFSKLPWFEAVVGPFCTNARTLILTRFYVSVPPNCFVLRFILS